MERSQRLLSLTIHLGKPDAYSATHAKLLFRLFSRSQERPRILLVSGIGQRRVAMALLLVGAGLVMMPGCADPDLRSPDPQSSPGKLLFTVRRGDGSVIQMADSGGSGLHEIETGEVAHFDAVWSPDGKKIASAGCVVGDCDYTSIYVMDADGTHLRQLTTGANPRDSDPAWSPDGTRIVFSRLLDDGHSRLFVVHIETGAVAQLTDDATYQDQDPDWSPDGTRIAFMRNADSFPSIYVIDADGTNLRRLVQMRPAADSAPAWSPDGTQIAFVRDEDQEGDYNLYVMDADGTDVHQLADVGGEDLLAPAPVWSPDGAYIAFFRGPVLHAIQVGSSSETTLFELDEPGGSRFGPGSVDWFA